MLSNMNKSERWVRMLTGGLIWALYLTDSMVGGFAHFLAVVGIILLGTAIMNCCPYYLACDLSTNKNQLSR